MIILGYNCEAKRKSQWCGVYYKYINQHKSKHCELIVNGFVHRYETDNNKQQLFIPNELRQLIFKYYYFANDKEWTFLEQRCPSQNKEANKDSFYLDSGYALVNDDNDIFIFGGRRGRYYHLQRNIFKYNISSNQLRRLTNIDCPKTGSGSSMEYFHAVYCKKSQMVHLIQTNYAKHVSISLSQLNAAESVLVDTTPDFL